MGASHVVLLLCSIFLCANQSDAQHPTGDPLCAPYQEAFDGSCYELVSLQRGFLRAQAWCERGGGHLAFILNEETQQFLQRHLSPGQDFWLGLAPVSQNLTLATSAPEGPLSWLDGSDISYANWAHDPPVDAACGHIVRDLGFQWEATDNCSQEFHFVCEFESGRSLACTDHNATLQCGSGQVIEVDNGFYGRKTLHYCRPRPTHLAPPTSSAPQEECSWVDVGDVMSGHCHWLQVCQVATGDVSSGEPCPSLGSYLSVEYHCRDGLLLLVNESAVVFHNITITLKWLLHPFQGNLTCTLNTGDGQNIDPYSPEGSESSLVHRYTHTGVFTITVECSTSEWHVTAQGAISVQEPADDFGIVRCYSFNRSGDSSECTAIYGSELAIQVELEAGTNITYRVQHGETVLAMATATRGIIPCNITLSPEAQQQLGAGCHQVALLASNNVMANAVSKTMQLCLREPVEGLWASVEPGRKPCLNPELQVSVSLDRGTPVQLQFQISGNKESFLEMKEMTSGSLQVFSIPARFQGPMNVKVRATNSISEMDLDVGSTAVVCSESKAGDRSRVLRDQQFTINANPSTVHPDTSSVQLEGKNMKNDPVSYNWMCTGNCSCNINSTNNTLVISQACLPPTFSPSVYTLVVTYKNHKNDTASRCVTVVPNDSNSVKIKCNLGCKQQNVTQTIQLQLQCNNCVKIKWFYINDSSDPGVLGKCFGRGTPGPLTLYAEDINNLTLSDQDVLSVITKVVALAIFKDGKSAYDIYNVRNTDSPSSTQATTLAYTTPTQTTRHGSATTTATTTRNSGRSNPTPSNDHTYSDSQSALPTLNCSLGPTQGSVLTAFSITCAASKTFCQTGSCTCCITTGSGQYLSCGNELVVKSLFLPEGDKSSNHRLALNVSLKNKEGKIINTTLTTKVTEASANTSLQELQVLISTQVNQQSSSRLAQLYSTVSGILNNPAKSNQEKTTRMKMRQEMLATMLVAVQTTQFSSAQEVQCVAETVVGITQVGRELTSTAQVQASSLLANLSQALLLINSSGSVGTAQTLLAAGPIVSAASNILTASADSNQQTSSPQEGRKISSSLLSAVDNVQSALLAGLGIDQEPVVLKTPEINISVNKMLSHKVKGTLFIRNSTSPAFTLPYLGSSILPVSQPVSVRMTSFGANPFSWSGGVPVSGVVGGLSLTREDGSVIPVGNLTTEIEIFLPRPNVSEVNVTLLNLRNFSTVAINVSKPNISLVLKLDPSENLTLQLLLGFQQYPNQSFNMAQTRLPQQGKTQEDQYTWVLGPENLTRTGVYYLLVKPVVGPGVNSTNATVFVTSISSQCVYWDEIRSNWSNTGCRVGPLTTPLATQCLCTHLTFFGSSFFVMPNVVDVSRTAELFATFANNPVVVCFVGAIVLVYLLVLVWARRKDIHDLTKVKITVLEDNDPLAQYCYLLHVSTGHRRGASTSSQVTVTLMGSEGDSDPHHLKDPDKPLFERGAVDMFLLTAPFSLGELQNIRMWHDNTGAYPSWYLSKVMVQDVETGQKWHFLCNSWLAVDMGECVLDKVFPVATEEDLKRFSNLFFTKTAKDFDDGHIWFSVVSRPPSSNFTRVQRVSCCFSLLLCTMLTNIMFYGIPKNPSEQKMDLGPIEFTWQQVMIGIQSSIIMFPINLLIVSIFRNTRPRERKSQQENNLAKVEPAQRGNTDPMPPTQPPSPENIHREITPEAVVKDIKKITQSLSKALRSPVPQMEMKTGRSSDINYMLALVEEIIRQQNRAGGDFYTENSKTESPLVLTLGTVNLQESSPSVSPERVLLDTQRQMNYSQYLYRQFQHVEKELEMLGEACFLNPSSYSLAVRQVQGMKAQLEVYLSSPRPTTEVLTESPGPHPSPSKCGCCKDGLPWWFVFVGWFLVVTTSGIAGYFTMMYGLTYGKDKSISWLISMVVSFFESLFITQPLKVLGFAAFFALVIKKVDQEDYGDLPIEKATVTSDPDGVLSARRDSTCSFYQPPAPTDVERMRNNMIKEQKVFALIREILIYLGFMWMLLMVAYGQRDPNAFFLNQHIEQSFGAGISDTMSLNDIFSWANSTLLSSLFGQYPGFITDGNSKLVGNARIRQVRVRKDSCTMSSYLQHYILDCDAPYSWEVEDMGTYGPGWSKPVNSNSTLMNGTKAYNTLAPFAWQYQSQDQLRAYPIWGSTALYRGGGFVADLGPDQGNASSILQYLFDETWLDEYTRAVFVEFTVYNANVNLFCIVTLMLETQATGGFQYRSELQIVRLYPSTSGLYFIMASEAIYFLFILYYMFVQGKLMKQHKWAYFSSKWNMLDLAIIILSWSTLSVFIKRTLQGNQDMEYYQNHQDQFVSFYNTAATDSVLGYLIAFLVLLATVKLWHLLRLNPKLNMITATLRRAWNDISGFIIVMVIMFLAYAIACNLLYGWKLYSYRTITDAAATIVSLQLGTFNYEEILNYNLALGAFLIGSCIIFMTFVVLNLFISVILVAFSKERLHYKPSEEEEIVDLMLFKLCSLFGMKSKKNEQDGAEGTKDHSSSFSAGNTVPAD